MLGQVEQALFIVIQKFGLVISFQKFNVLSDSGLCNIQPVCRLSIVPGLAQDQECFQLLI